jgi:hypothetical protein
VDRFVDRVTRAKSAIRAIGGDSVVFVQLVRTMHGTVVLIIRRS